MGSEMCIRDSKLTYGMPASMGEEIREQISHFNVEIPAEDVRKIWKCCRDSATSSEFAEEEMEAFHRFALKMEFQACPHLHSPF